MTNLLKKIRLISDLSIAKQLLVLAVLLLSCQNAMATILQFESDGIYYVQSSTVSSEVSVTCGANMYTGDIVIPAEVAYRGATFKVTKIAKSAFRNCSGVTSVSLPENIVAVGDSAFAVCTRLAAIKIPSGVPSIGNYTFYGCTSLSSVTIPNSVTTIGNYAFYGCIGLSLTSFPESVVSVGNYAFFGCLGMPALTFSSPTTSIGKYAFYGCIGLPSVSFTSSVKSIGNYAFYGCIGITSLTFASKVNTIGSSAFQGCSGVPSLTFPSSVDSIGEYAFQGCSSMVSLDLGSTTAIGKSAFSDCSCLESVYISYGLERIWSSAFEYCSSLKRVETNSLSEWYEISFADSDSNPLKYAGVLYADGNVVTDLVVPDGITEILPYAFYGAKKIKSVKSGSHLLIRTCAFYDCSNLEEVYMAAGGSIAGGISTDALANTTSLKKIYIGDMPYDANKGLFYFGKQSNCAVKSVYIGCDSFCPSPTYIPQRMGVIIVYNTPFAYSSSLTSIEFGDEVTRIWEGFCNSCESLKVIKLGKNVASSVNGIDWSVFDGCSNVDTIISLSPIPTTGIVVPDNVYKKSVLLVSEGSLEAYKESKYSWRRFLNIQEIKPLGVDDAIADHRNPVTVSGSGIDVEGREPCVVATPSGSVIYSGKAPCSVSVSPGLYVVRVGSTASKVIVK